MKQVRGDIEHHTLVVHWVGFLFPGRSFLFLNFFAVEKKDHLYEWICEHKKRTYRFMWFETKCNDNMPSMQSGHLRKINEKFLLNFGGRPPQNQNHKLISNFSSNRILA